MGNGGGPAGGSRWRLEVAGHLAGDWSEWLDGLRVANLPNGNTLLVGDVTDQAALHGLLQKVSALGLSLVAVNRDQGQ